MLLASASIIVQAKNKTVNMQDYLTNMPKIELHLHIEGSLNPETVAKLANDNSLDFFTTAEEVQQSISDREPGLNGFLSHYYKALEVLKTEQDFYNATYDLLKILKTNNIVYADLFFDPQEHTSRDIPFDVFFAGIDKGRIAGEKDFGIRINLIMCLNRSLSELSAFEMLKQAVPYRDRIIGFGMDSGPEYGNPPVKFKNVFAEARKQGYKLTGHHDVHVQDSVKHIWQSIDVLKLDRIDHGLDAILDTRLMAALKQRRICLTGSPVKRSTDPEPQDLKALKILDEHGVCVSLHSDDPGQFESGYLTNMMILVQSAGKFSKVEMTRFMLNAYRAVWLTEAQKKVYISHLKAYAEQHDVAWNEVSR